MFAVILFPFGDSLEERVIEVGFFHNRYLAVCVSVFRCMGIVEVAFSLFETRFFDSDVFNLVVSSVLGGASKIGVR